MSAHSLRTLSQGVIDDLALPHDLYSPLCIAQARAAYEAYCVIDAQEAADLTRITVRVLPSHQAQGRDILWSLLTYLVATASRGA